MKNYIVLLGIILLLLPMVFSLGTLNTVSKGYEWNVIYSNDEDYLVYIAEKNKQKTEICLLSKTVTQLQDLPSNHKNIYDEQGNLIETLNSKKKTLDKNYYGYCRIVDTETYLKFGEYSTILIYQDIKLLEYKLDWGSLNITLYKNISGTWNNTIPDIFVYYNVDNYKFGAEDYFNNDTEIYKYHIKSNMELFYDYWRIFFLENLDSSEKNILDFTDICSKSKNDFSYDCEITFYENESFYYADIIFKSDNIIDPFIYTENETTLTWNNQPCGVNFDNSTNCNLTALYTSIETGIGWQCWNVTSAVEKQFLINNKTIALVLKTPELSSLGDDYFYTKETTSTQYRPQLNITYTFGGVNYTKTLQDNYTENLLDTYVWKYSPNNNYGTSVVTGVRDNGVYTKRSYHLFNISFLNDSITDIVDSQFCLYRYYDGTTNSTSVYHVYNPEITPLPPFNITDSVEMTLEVPQYPYVDANMTYPLKVYLIYNNSYIQVDNVYINITNGGNTSMFNFSWDGTSGYDLNLLFTSEGDYNFIIWGEDDIYLNIETIIGTFLVRKPFYITFKLFEQKDQDVSSYQNDFAYIILEKKQNRYYDENLENFFSPLFFKQTYNLSVFHAIYNDGQAIVKLWDEGEYAVRIIDGQINFANSYSPPNITKSYGTNSYLGILNLYQNESYNVLVTEKDIYQFRWLANWLFIISIIGIIVISVFLFFVIPSIPQLSFFFGIGFASLIVLLRVILWFWKGY